MDKAKLNEILKEVIKEAQELKIPVPDTISERIIINSRPRKRYGCCRKKGREFSIEISEFVLGCEESKVKQIVAHEVLHTCEGCYDHGEKWKLYADAMNKAYGYNIRRVSSLEELGLSPKEEGKGDTKVRYIIKCRKCGKEYPRQRASRVTQNIKQYRCRCGGKLQVFSAESKNN